MQCVMCLVILKPVNASCQHPSCDACDLYRFHAAEAQRAQQWVQYFENLAYNGYDGNRYTSLLQQWKSYTATQRQWEEYYHLQMQLASSSFSSMRNEVAKVEMPERLAPGSFTIDQTSAWTRMPPVVLQGEHAFGLNSLPLLVHKMLAAGNQLQQKPYIWGGGHRNLEDYGYDCSSAVSYLLIKAGLLGRVLNTRSLASYGEPGPGRFVTLWVKPGSHVFMTICGLRLDTTGGSVSQGPRWRTAARSCAGFVPRHPAGL
jgi:hypothetical protein